MSKTAYENLEIHQLAVALARSVWEMVKNWERFEKDTIGKQLVRAADSVGANIAEGYGRGNGPDQRRFLRIARGSVYETKHWLRLAYTRKLTAQSDVDALQPLIEKIPPKLNAYLRAVGRKRTTTIDTLQSTIQL